MCSFVHTAGFGAVPCATIFPLCPLCLTRPYISTPLHDSTGAVLPLMKTLFDSVLTSGYGLTKDKDGFYIKKMSRVVRAVLEDKSIVVGLDLGKQDMDLFLLKLET